MDNAGTKSRNVWPHITRTVYQDLAHSPDLSLGRLAIEDLKDLIKDFGDLIAFLKMMILKLPTEHQAKKFYSLAKHNYSIASKTLAYHPASARDQMRRPLRDYAIRLAKFQLRDRLITRALTFLLIALPLCAPDFIRPKTTSSYLATWIAVAIVVLILSLAEKMSPHRGVARFIGFVAAGSISALIGFSLFPNEIRRPMQTLISGHGGWADLCLVVIASSIYIALVAVPASIVGGQIRMRCLLRNIPECAVIYHLSYALTCLLSDDARFYNVSNRKHVISHIEGAAICISQGIPDAAAVSDSNANNTVRQRCAQAAAAIRELEVRIALPGARTLEETRHEVAYIIGIICQGAYDLLPTGTLTEPQRTRFIVRALLFARTIVVGLLPLIVLFGARHGGLRLAPGFENWAIVIGMIWAAVVYITLLDPLYANRIKAVREFIDAFRGIAR